MGTGELNAGSNPVMDWHPMEGEVEIFLVASCYCNREKPILTSSLGSYAAYEPKTLKSRQTLSFTLGTVLQDLQVILFWLIPSAIFNESAHSFVYF